MEILTEVKTIAVVGISDKPERPSCRVATYLQEQGYRIVPVNPRLTDMLGEQVYPELSSIPSHIRVDLVDIFRKSDEIVPIVKEAIGRGVKVIWLQEGIVNQEAVKLAQAAGIKIEMDKCLMKAHRACKEKAGRTD